MSDHSRSSSAFAIGGAMRKSPINRFAPHVSSPVARCDATVSMSLDRGSLAAHRARMPLSKADKNLRSLLTSAQVTLLAFRDQADAGALDPRQHSALRILEASVQLYAADPAAAFAREDLAAGAPLS